MIARLSSLATGAGNARRVLIGAGVLFLLAAAFGAPVTTILKSSNTDFQNPSAENQQVEKTIERATGQRAAYGVAALVPSAGDVRTNTAAQLEARHVAAMLATQPGFQRVVDYPATHLAALVSRNGRQTAVLAAFSTQEGQPRRSRGCARGWPRRMCASAAPTWPSAKSTSAPPRTCARPSSWPSRSCCCSPSGSSAA